MDGSAAVHFSICSAFVIYRRMANYFHHCNTFLNVYYAYTTESTAELRRAAIATKILIR